jgi:hypothetical protein
MNELEPGDVYALLPELEPRLREGYRLEAAPLDESFWELRFERNGRRHRLKIDPVYIAACLHGGTCRHLRGLLGEVCDFLEGQ